MKTIASGCALTALFLGLVPGLAAQQVVDSFEEQELRWAVPDWATEKPDHVAKQVELSKDKASAGTQSVKINADFPGEIWSAAVIELEDYLDFTGAKKVAVDIYVPADTPEGLQGNIVFTVGNDWKWVEQLRPVSLKPGKWTTVEADLNDGSKDWKKTRVDDEFRADVRKIDIRVISDKKPKYAGPVYIDNIRTE